MQKKHLPVSLLAGAYVLLLCIALHMCTHTVDNQQMETCVFPKARLGVHLCALFR